MGGEVLAWSREWIQLSQPDHGRSCLLASSSQIATQRLPACQIVHWALCAELETSITQLVNAHLKMSGLEVIGAISAVIGIVDASIKIYESAQKDVKLSDTFHIVGRRLPIVLDTLQTCKTHLQPIRDSLPADVCAALEKNLEGCDEKARKLSKSLKRFYLEEMVRGSNGT